MGELPELLQLLLPLPLLPKKKKVDCFLAPLLHLSIQNGYVLEYVYVLQ
jgi:hypothetical protein